MHWFWSPLKIKSVIVSTVSASTFHEVMGPDAMISIFWILSFKPTFSLSSAYMRLLIFLLAILIPGKNIISLISILTSWWRPCVESSLVCWKSMFAMASAFSWQHSIIFSPASFCTPRPNLHVTTGISWLPTFAFQSPIMKRTPFLGVSSIWSYRSS